MYKPQKKFPHLFFLPLLFFSLLFSENLFAQTQTLENRVAAAYSAVPNDLSLKTSQQFILVDDFNTGKFVEREGATWRTKVPAMGALDLAIEKGDSRSDVRGYALKAHYNLQAKEQVTFETFLEKVDVSKAEALVFKIKIKPKGDSFKGKIYVTLHDWKHDESLLAITNYLPQNQDEWVTVSIPLNKFTSVDPDQLISIKFTLSSGQQPIRGYLWIDELSFYGDGNVAFESHRDNVSAFPEKIFEDNRRKELLKEKNDKKLLKKIAEDTWRYFEFAHDKKTKLVADHIRLGEAPLIGNYTSLTNIAMDFMSAIGTMEMGIISKDEARQHVGDILATLEKLPTYNGFFYNFYDINKLSIQRKYLSTVDAGWLAVSLVVVRQAFKEEYFDRASALLDAMNFAPFLDPENNQLFVGIDVPITQFEGYHYGMLVTEARATSLVAIGKGDIPEDHWWFLYRTLPDVWRWQRQEPKGKYVTGPSGIEYFQGYYEKGDKKFVPSWGGSLFETLMPTLVLNENKISPNGFGANNRAVTELHRDYCLKEKGYPVWGLSPCAVSSGRHWIYREYGVADLGAKGYPDRGVVTPHVSFLALNTLPKDAIQNIRKLLEYEIYGEYGFYDALNLRSETVNPQYLALDQGMILISIANYLEDGAIQDYFHRDPIGKKAEEIIGDEAFF